MNIFSHGQENALPYYLIQIDRADQMLQTIYRQPIELINFVGIMRDLARETHLVQECDLVLKDIYRQDESTPLSYFNQPHVIMNINRWFDRLLDLRQMNKAPESFVSFSATFHLSMKLVVISD